MILFTTICSFTRWEWINLFNQPCQKAKKFLWSWQGSNLRPSRCKRDALPAELQPLVKEIPCNSFKWVWVDSNYRPPPYQSGALTDWATNPKKIVCARKSIWFDLLSSYNEILLRKEVIQPHLPVRLPCYDFAPVTNLTLDSFLPRVKILALGTTGFHGVTGGVYKTRERIHRGMLIRDY